MRRATLALPLVCSCLLTACAGLQGEAKNAQGEAVFASGNSAPVAPLYNNHAQERANPPLLTRMLSLFRPEPKAPSDVRAQLQALAGSALPYRMGVGDVLDVDISGLAQSADVRGQFSINAQGVIDLGALGAYRLQGLTPTQAQRVLRTALETPLHSPQVHVRIDQYRSQFVRMLGEVYAPGDYYIDAAPMSLAEAITRAGGLLERADLSLIVFTRGEQTQNLDLRQLYDWGLPPQELMLRHGDVLRFTPKE